MRMVKKFPCSARAFRARRVDLPLDDDVYPEALFSFRAVLTRVEFSYSIRYVCVGLVDVVYLWMSYIFFTTF